MTRAPRSSAALRGYDKDWWRLRARHLRANPWCVWCMRQGKQVKGQHVDHIETIREAPLRRLDPMNLQTLCERHHGLLTDAFDSGDMRGACDDDGLPLDPTHPWAQTNAAQALANVNTRFMPQRAPPGLAAKLKMRAVRGVRK